MPRCRPNRDGVHRRFSAILLRHGLPGPNFIGCGHKWAPCPGSPFFGFCGVSIKVKICGVRSEAALDAAAEAGADFIGLVFFPRSPRHLTLEAGRDLAKRASGRVATVALLVDPEDALVDEIVSAVRPDYLQLNGGETPDRVAEIIRRSGRPVIKAVGVESAEDAKGAARFDGIAEFVLFDAKAPAGERPGGRGVTFDWSLMAGAPGFFALSGGLTPGNVAQAIAETGAPMVDVSSGVESTPGEKDNDLIRGFIAAAKAAAPVEARRVS
jgi:phosphoribosylanthranilate isomerase